MKMFRVKKNFQTEAALIHDAVCLFSQALEDNTTLVDQFFINSLSCYDDYSNYDDNNQWSDSGRDVLTKIDEVCSAVILK